jgi:rare lipoprotein A
VPGLIALALISCGTQEPRDGAPSREVDISRIPDAVPRYEPIRKAGNKSPYVVFGKKYEVMPTSRGYRQQGTASWYGTKFHGRNTSNGESYDMYAMTAAHKTLPIPSYVQVTNLQNGKKVIVRVNDRGPFHGDRIIDLSYVAAMKLGYAEVGTAPVEVVAIDPASYHGNTAAATTSPLKSADVGARAYLQAGAFSSRQAAEKNGKYLRAKTGYPVAVRQDSEGGRTLYKVLIGPLADQSQVAGLRSSLQQTENIATFVVYD